MKIKKFVILFILFAINQSVSAQGIIFEPTIDAAIKKAQATGKPIFVECYHPNCPICLSLEPTLKNAQVGKYYNQNFVNFKLNLSDANQVKYLDKKKIRLISYPLFLYFDKNQNIIHSTDPLNTAEGFIQHGQDALNPSVRTGDTKRRYESGEKNIDLLVGLAYLSRITFDTTTAMKASNDLFEIFPKDQLGTELSWKITKKCVIDVENGFAKYWFDNIAVAAEFEKKEGHPDNEKNSLGWIVQSTLFSPRAAKYSTNQINVIKDYMTRLGAGQFVMANTWQVEIPALIREGRANEALNIANQMAQSYATNGQALVFITKFMNDNFTDAQYATAGQDLLKKARPLLKDNKDLVEYYYESARLNQKSGNTEAAKKDAQQGKTYATLAKVDVKRFEGF
jgi:thiol-disulfide isomerase/thioredoxin